MHLPGLLTTFGGLTPQTVWSMALADYLVLVRVLTAREVAQQRAEAQSAAQGHRIGGPFG